LNITIGEDFQGDFFKSFLTPKDEAKLKFMGILEKLGTVLFFRIVAWGQALSFLKAWG